MSLLESSVKIENGLRLGKVQPEVEQEGDFLPFPISLHPSFHPVYAKLTRWLARFPESFDTSILNELLLLYLLNTKKYLDHRNPTHFFRLVLSIYRMQKKLFDATTLFPQKRHLEVRLLPTSLVFPFSSRPVLGCLIGINMLDRNELFDEENVLIALRKHLPDLRLVNESAYSHTQQNKSLRIFYFEIEKNNGDPLTLADQKLVKSKLEEKVKYSIQSLAPPVFVRRNEEEVYKNILTLSRQIQSIDDQPQVFTTFDQQTAKEIIFCVTLVYVSPFHRFSLRECFTDCLFVSELVSVVRHIKGIHPVEAHVFRLHLPRDASLMRSDASLDFYSARRRVTDLIRRAIGDFRDYNGSIIIKQQELLQEFKNNFPDEATHNSELMESFLYSLLPVQKQLILHGDVLNALFTYFLENRKNKLSESSPYSCDIHHKGSLAFLTVRGEDSTLIEAITIVMQEPAFKTVDFAYNILDTLDGVFFNCVFLRAEADDAQRCIHALQQSLDRWCHKINSRQILRIALDYPVVSLDPRIGGDSVSSNILGLLFEGLTRFNQNGQIENALAESIEISSNSKQYTFKLRPALWNDGSPVTAHDFEYAWKKILSPDFKTAFAYLFYPIKNAKEAKEGHVPPEKIGINALDNRTLQVELTCPTTYFLRCTALTLYSPVHRVLDEQYPQWPYQCEKQYPCNGPFQVRINHPNKGYQLIKNPLYWDSTQVQLEQITLTRMNTFEAFQRFQKKEIDWVGNPFGGWDMSYGAEKEGRIVSFPNNQVCWCVFNASSTPFHHPKLRQAFAYAIRRNEILQNPFFSLNPAYSVLLPHHQKKSVPLFPDYDPTKARELFQEALDEMGMHLTDFPCLTITFNQKGIREHAALCLKRQFEECFGITCQLQPLPWNMVFGKLTKGSFQIGLVHWTPWMDDPIYTLAAFKSAKEELNFAKWEHPEFRRLIDLSEQEGNPFQRSAYFLKAEEILSREAPVVPLFYQPYQMLVQKDLQVYYPSPCGTANIARSFYNKQ